MSIRLPKAEKADYVRRLQEYVQAELDLEIGELGAEFLFDFVAGLAGPVYYNEALEDARAVASLLMPKPTMSSSASAPTPPSTRRTATASTGRATI